MSNDQRVSRPQGRTLDVTVRLLGVREGDALPDVHVYAFTSPGRACDVRRVSAEGRANSTFRRRPGRR